MTVSVLWTTHHCSSQPKPSFNNIVAVQQRPAWAAGTGGWSIEATGFTLAISHCPWCGVQLPLDSRPRLDPT
jgi:hypothetical protein